MQVDLLTRLTVFSPGTSTAPTLPIALLSQATGCCQLEEVVSFSAISTASSMQQSEGGRCRRSSVGKQECHGNSMATRIYSVLCESTEKIHLQLSQAWILP